MKHTGIATYFQQRFPLFGVLFISLTTSVSTTGLYSGIPDYDQLIVIAAVTVAFAAFLLRQRIVDEFKDKHHDDKNFPDRPFQSGIVSARTLKIIGVAAIAIELTAVYFAGAVTSLLWYLPVVAFSLLMMNEFFISKWLERHFTFYFVLHEMVFILYGIWLCAVVGVTITTQSTAWVAYFTLVMMAIEVGRKYPLRKSPTGHIVKDTYVAVWGKDITVSLLCLLLVLAGTALAYSETTLQVILIPTIAVPFIYMFKHKDKWVQAIIIATALTMVAAGIVL